MSQFDVVILTESRYVNPKKIDDYIQNVLTEDELLKKALENFGLKVGRKDWADQDFDWRDTKSAVFRSTWDYFDRFKEFITWLNRAESQTIFINPISQIRWNLDKRYLRDLEYQGVHIVETKYIKKGETKSLSNLLIESGWEDLILKPTIAGAARHTYRLNLNNLDEYEPIFKDLIKDEDMMLQPFQHQIMEKGEMSFIIIGGRYTHSVLKKGKEGDFRVQDDFGGTLHNLNPSIEEIRFAEEVVQACKPLPAYARVDVMWNNDRELAVSEVELIEPELWFRRNPEAAKELATVILDRLNLSHF